MLLPNPKIIRPDDTTPLLGSRLAEIGGQLIRKTLPKLLEDNFTALQSKMRMKLLTVESSKKMKVEYAGLKKRSYEIERKLRSFTPWPGIFTFYSISEKNGNKRRIQLTKVEVVNESFEPGKILSGIDQWELVPEVCESCVLNRKASRKWMQIHFYEETPKSWEQCWNNSL